MHVTRIRAVTKQIAAAPMAILISFCFILFLFTCAMVPYKQIAFTISERLQL